MITTLRSVLGSAADGAPIDGALVTDAGRRQATAILRAAGYAGTVIAACDAPSSVRWWPDNTVGWWASRYPAARGTVRRVSDGWRVVYPAGSTHIIADDLDRADVVAIAAARYPWVRFRR